MHVLQTPKNGWMQNQCSLNGGLLQHAPCLIFHTQGILIKTGKFETTRLNANKYQQQVSEGAEMKW